MKSIKNPYLIKLVKVKRQSRNEDAGKLQAAIYQQAALNDPAGPWGSTLELRVYKALLSLGWKPGQIEAQVDIMGGSKLKGGQRIDMVLWGPRPQPIAINGEYWHQDLADETIKGLEVYKKYGVLPIIIWGNDAATFEQARQTCLRLIGRPT